MEVRWRRQLHVRGSEVVVAGTALAVTERDTHLVALDAATGEVRWDVGGIAGNAVLATGSGVVVARDEHGRTTCVDVGSGSVRWTAQGPGGLRDLVTVSQGVVLGGGWRGYQPQCARSLDEGEQLWRAKRPAKRVQPVPFAHGVLTGDPARTDVWVLDPRTGDVDTRWQLPAPVAAPDLSPAPFRVDRDEALLHTVDDRVLALAVGGDVRELWRHPRPIASGVVATRTRGRLWVPESGGGLTVVDEESGRPVARFASAEPVVGMVAVGGGAVVADRSGVVTWWGNDGVLLGRATVPRPVEAAVGSPGLVHVVGKGHLTTFAPALSA